MNEEGRDTQWPDPLLSHSLTPDVSSSPCCQEPTEVDGVSSGWAGPVAPSAVIAQPSSTEASLELMASTPRLAYLSLVGQLSVSPLSRV